ncbi:hypothetical protein JST97_10480 [bacterium]|nr:hypothetical protein [bacterium]
MIRRLKNYIERVKVIHENPFWVTSRSRAARASAMKTLWRGYAGYAFLLMLPLGLFTNYLVESTGLTTDSDQVTLAGALAVAGVLQLLYLSTKAALSTAPSVVQARQQGTLLALALTRINSADFADGVALSEARFLIREFAVWTPALAMVTWMCGQTAYSLLMLLVLSTLCVLYFAYNGVYISATCKDTQEAGRKATINTMVTMAGSGMLFLIGGFVLGPLWLLHPVFAYLCSMYGAGSPSGPSMQESISLLFWCGWPAVITPVYMWLILNVRQSAIRALERVRIG